MTADSNTDDQVRWDFAKPMQGDAVHDLQQYTLLTNRHIRENNQYDLVYAKTFPILQSSGTGKTKLVVQLSAFQAGLLVCTRRPKSQWTISTSFPPSDNSVYSFLRLAYQGRQDCLSTHYRIASWLGAYFDQLRSQLQQRMERSGCFEANGEPRHENVHACWSTIVYDFALAIHHGPDFIEKYDFGAQCSPRNLCQQSKLQTGRSEHGLHEPATVMDVNSRRFRTKFLEDVAEQARSSLQRLYSSQDPEHVKTSSAPSGSRPGLQPQAFDPSEADASSEIVPEQYARQAAARFMTKPLEQLERLLPRALVDSHFFFLAIDEVSELRDLLPVFRRLWREAAPECSWLMLIDTDPSIAMQVGQEVAEASARSGAVDGLIVVDPYPFLPFDVAFEGSSLRRLPKLLSGGLTFGDLLDTLRHFGRPLWSTALYSADDPTSKQVYPHTVVILRKLLMYAERTEMWPSRNRRKRFETVLATIAHRLPLRFVGTRRARNVDGDKRTPPFSSAVAATASASDPVLESSAAFLHEQVATHLRIISEVDGCNYLGTTVVSEPPLSLAVASLMRGKGSDAYKECCDRWSDVVDVLSAGRSSVGLMLGEEGEECVRLLCSLAMDLAAARRVQTASPGGKSRQTELDTLTMQCNPVCLRDWLCELLRRERLDDKLLEWSSRFYLNFTHFFELSRWVSPGEIAAMLLVEGWWRQVAFYRKAALCGWDLLIPIYFSEDPPELSDRFDPSQLSYAALQVRDHLDYGSASEDIGPFYRIADDVSAGVGTDDSLLRIRDECLEILIDIRCPTHTPHPYVHQAQRVGSDSQFVGSTAIRHSHYNRLIVTGWSVDVFGVVGRLSPEAQRQMGRLFDLADTHTEEAARRMRECSATTGLRDIRQCCKYGGQLHTCYTNVEAQASRTMAQFDEPGRARKLRNYTSSSDAGDPSAVAKSKVGHDEHGARHDDDDEEILPPAKAADAGPNRLDESAED